MSQIILQFFLHYWFVSLNEQIFSDIPIGQYDTTPNCIKSDFDILIIYKYIVVSSD